MDVFRNISIIFVSIFLESLPFLLLGSLISSIIENYVSNDTIAKLIPKNKILGTIAGIFCGFFLPACDCAVIPISKRLFQKGVPINVVISFMLASPIINPVVLLATYNAFYKTNPHMFWYRLIYGIIIAFIIGYIMGLIFDKKDVVKPSLECECHHHHKGIISVLEHTGIDLYEVLKYLIVGALIASLIQALLPQNVLAIFHNNNILSVLILMVFAYLISLCSTSDAFIGKTFTNIFTNNSIMAYLLLGPMIDIKNTIVLLGNYKRNFVLTLISLIFIVIFIFSMVVYRL